MIFVDRPITAQHIRDACERFNEGVRVEYKSTLDISVREQLPKIVSSFANSQGGVLIVGINAVNGVPRGPFEGFVPQQREEFPLTVENICLRNIYPPVLPRTHVVQSDTANHIFVVVEVDESGESPHAIENSRRVYVRTGNAANPYDLAEVDLIIDLLKRRTEPLERANRLLTAAEQRARQTVPQELPLMQLSVGPTFPRQPICTSRESWGFLREQALRDANQAHYVPANSMKRVPNGAACLVHQSPDHAYIRPHYVEFSNFGLVFIARQFFVSDWAGVESLAFGDLFQLLVRLTSWGGALYTRYGYHGSLNVEVSLRNVQGWPMRFIDADGPFFDYGPDDFRCYTNAVSSGRLMSVEQFRSNRLDAITDVLTELTWSFWQGNGDHPTAQLRRYAERALQPR